MMLPLKETPQMWLTPCQYFFTINKSKLLPKWWLLLCNSICEALLRESKEIGKAFICTSMLSQQKLLVCWLLKAFSSCRFECHLATQIASWLTLSICVFNPKTYQKDSWHRPTSLRCFAEIWRKASSGCCMEMTTLSFSWMQCKRWSKTWTLRCLTFWQARLHTPVVSSCYLCKSQETIYTDHTHEVGLTLTYDHSPIFSLVWGSYILIYANSKTLSPDIWISHNLDLIFHRIWAWCADHMWWTAKWKDANGNPGEESHHPHSEAPLCVPCNYTGNTSTLDFHYPVGCPCRPADLCAADHKGNAPPDISVCVYIWNMQYIAISQFL